MTHDPYQTYQTVNALSGLTNPFSSPYNAVQTSAINPMAANAGAWGVPTAIPQMVGPQGYAGFQGVPGVANFAGISPHSLHLAGQLGLSPFANAWQNPLLGVVAQNPFVAAGLQNPVIAAAVQNQIAAALQNPLVLAQLAYAMGQQPNYSPYGQQQQPYGQQPFGQQQPYQQLGQIGLGQQTGSPFNQFTTPLAPQSWIGQGVPGPFGVGQGQMQPFFPQGANRGIHGQGINPWAAF
jgi:hypothetical protein